MSESASCADENKKRQAQKNENLRAHFEEVAGDLRDRIPTVGVRLKVTMLRDHSRHIKHATLFVVSNSRTVGEYLPLVPTTTVEIAYAKGHLSSVALQHRVSKPAVARCRRAIAAAHLGMQDRLCNAMVVAFEAARKDCNIASTTSGLTRRRKIVLPN